MRIGVVGSRRRNDKKNVYYLVKNFDDNDVVVSGGCEGVDTWAEEKAKEIGLDTIVIKPCLIHSDKLDYYETCEVYYFRNKQIVKNSDIIYAFVSDDRSGGTENTIKHARNLDVEYYIVDKEGHIKEDDMYE